MVEKVYLPAIAGHVLSEMVHAVQDLIEFSYLVCQSVINKDTLSHLDKTLQNFHTHREVFRDLDVQPEGF